MKQINCNFCGSDNTKFLYETKDRMIRRNDQKKFNIVVCKNCRLAYLNPQPEWEDLEYFYGDTYYTNAQIGNNKKSAIYNLIRKIKRAVIGPYKPKFWNFKKENGNFLDIGCGNGAYESYLIKDNSGWEFYGVEPNKNSFQVAKNIEGFKVFNGNLKQADYPADFFDVILMSHSLEHLSDPMLSLKECYRILKPGGHLVVNVPNFNSLARRFFGKYWFHLDAPRHLFHFTPNVLEKMMEKSGFKIKQIKFEVLSGSITRSLAYRFNKDKFFFEKPIISLIIHYLIFPIDRFIELIYLASGFKIIVLKKKF